MNVISMSLWGTSELYVQGAVCNARLAPEIYPGWSLRIYCSPEVPVLEQLRALGADVRVVPSAPSNAGLFWRFLPAGEVELEHVIFRDADSRLNLRENAAVDAWIASGKPFHVMRDHPSHRREPMLAGMWGCRGGSIPDMRERIARFENGASNRDDVKFLREEIWPLAEGRCLVHSSVPEPLGGDPFPAHPPIHGYVGEIVDPRAEAKDILAMFFPSRRRPEGALAAVRSALATAAAPERLRVVVGVEPDDADDYRAAFAQEPAVWVHVLRSGGNYVRAMRELFHATPAGIYGLGADDFVFETPGWDVQIRAAIEKLPERTGLVFPNDGVQSEIATAPFLTAEWIALVGDILPGNYEHMFCDTEITDIARQAGLLRFLPEVKVTHRHYLFGDVAIDATYERSRATMSSGRVEFDRRGGERQRIADRLAQASRAPLLSILISSLVQRAATLGRLLERLRGQLEQLPDASIVEVLVEPDAGERSLSAKRKNLLSRARGRWVAFIDEGDLVTDDAISTVLRALEDDIDGLTYSPASVLGAATSKPVLALRRRVADAVARKDFTGREDFKWSGTMLPFLKHEATIGRNLFPEAAGANAIGALAPAVQKAEESSRGDAATTGLPSPAQQLLLAAALRRDETALRAWATCSSDVRPDLADPLSARIFPLVWWNLQRLGAEGMEVNGLKPFYWNSWAASHAHLRLVDEIAAALQRAGIPILLVGGAALASRYYEQQALRPTDIVDLMIPASRAGEAERVLSIARWAKKVAASDSAPEHHRATFKDRSGRRFHLRWSALEKSGAAEESFWARAEAMQREDTSTHVLSATDQLLHVCVFGLGSTAPASIQWVADVVAILHSAADRIDWDVLAAEARARGVALKVRGALDYVRVAFDVAALDDACRRLHSTRSTIPERRLIL